MLLGVVLASPDATMVRFLSTAGAASMCIITWKAVFMVCVTGLCTLVKSGGPRGLLAGFRSGPGYICLAAVFDGSSGILLPLSLTLTSTANALLLLSLNPLWAALFGRLVLQERLPWRTVAALACAFCSTAVIFVPASLQKGPQGREGGAAFLGDCAALACGWLIAGYMTVVRFAGKHAPDTQMPIAAALGALLTVLTAAALAGGRALPGPGGFDPERPIWQFWAVIVADGASNSACHLATSTAPAFISGVEAGLIFLLVVILSPLLVWLCYGDVPTWWTLLGGAALVLTLVVHDVATLLESNKCGGTDGDKGGSKRACPASSGDANNDESGVGCDPEGANSFPEPPARISAEEANGSVLIG